MNTIFKVFGRKHSESRAFTLIELLVTISIIAILTGIIVTSLTASKAKSRDAARVSDLNQIQLALEQYFDRCGQYPTSLVTTANNGCPTGITFASYIAKIPTDPSTNTAYGYATSGSYPSDYVLHVTLETGNAAQQNSLAPFPTTGTWSATYQCYDSSHLLEYCTGPK